MKHVKFFLALTALACFTGCASITMVNSSRQQSVAAKSYRSFLVVGISQNRQNRQVFEEVLVAELRKKGFAATASYTVTGIEDELSRTAIVDAVQKLSADAVITTRVVDLKKQTHTAVGYTMTSRGIVGPVSFATFDMKPVDVTTSKTYALGTDLFDTATQNLVWSGTTDAVDPKGIITVSKEYAGVVIETLNKEGLIK